MIDILALVLSHGLLALAAWRLLQRDDLDRDPPVTDAAGGEDGDRKDGASLKNGGLKNGGLKIGGLKIGERGALPRA